MRKVSFVLGAISLLILITPAVSSSQITYVIDASAPYDYIPGTNPIASASWLSDCVPQPPLSCALPADDGYFDLSLTDLGFVFQFYGIPVTNLRISTNGYLTFGSEVGWENWNYPIPSPASPNALIAPFWTDLDLTNNGLVRWGIIDTSSPRQLVVEWFEVPPWGGAGGPHYSFEAILYESTNEIKFQYLDVESGTPWLTSGVENFDGTSGSQFFYGSRTSTLSDGVAVEFIPKITTVFFDDFSTDKGWTGYEIGGWERGPAVAGVAENGNPDPGVDHSSDNYILGFAIGADYPNDLIEEKSIISPSIDCTELGQVFLKFWRYLNVQNNSYDHAKVYASNDGTNWTQLWENPVFDITDSQWTQVVFDISSVAANQANVYIKFTMGPTNATGRYSGWNIDDLEVTSVYGGPMALYVPSGGMANTNIDEIMIENGLGIKHFNLIPSDLSDYYDLLIVSDDGACDLTTADYIKNFVQNGGGAIIMNGTPNSLAGNTGDLSPIKDWFGAGLYGNDGGYGTVTVPNPFGTDLSVDAQVDYSAANLAPAVYDLQAGSDLISKWSSDGTHSFSRRFGQGRVLYYAGKPGYSEDPNPIIVENGLILFEAGLLWATGCSGPVVAVHPQSQTIQSGQTAWMWVSAWGTAPFSYQWYQGASGDISNPISGGIADSYTTPSLTETTNYWVKVSNACGFALSNTATITVGAACTSPSFTSQPQSQTIESGQTASMSVSASGSTPLSYQWYQGSSGDTSNPISGATSSSYTTLALTQTTSYWVGVTNSCGSANTNTATITVEVPDISDISLVSPNGGETWSAGSMQTIRWTYTSNLNSPVKVELLKGGAVNRTIAASASKGSGGSGSRNWTIPANQAPGADYRIRVTSTTNGNYTDTSANDFTIAAPTITVVSPNSGETWPAGSRQTIRWNYTGNPGAYVKIELLKGGVLNRTIASSAGKGRGGSGSRNWTIPANQAPGTDYTIRVTSTSNGAYTDTSDSDFTVAAPTITVVSPDGGETWTIGSTQTIRWNYTGNPGAYVKIELLKGGVLNRTIASPGKGVGGSGSRNWTIPANQAPGADYSIRVTSTSNGAYTDTSDSDFTIE